MGAAQELRRRPLLDAEGVDDVAEKRFAVVA
jgi:hypothetical protein